MSRFEKITDAAGVHIITRDLRTGLEWAVQDLGLHTNLKHGSKAAQACTELTLGGSSDWRLPTVDELESIRDRTKFRPAIDAEAFPGCPSDLFWTSTADAEDPSEFAWVVLFLRGHSVIRGRVYRYRVRAVRGSSRQFSDSLDVESKEAVAA